MSDALVRVQSRKLAPKLLAAIAGLEVQTRRQAELNLGETTLSGPGREAAVLAEQLAVLSHEVSYAHSRLRGEILARLEIGDLYRFHPSDPQSLEDLAAERGMSRSEVSDLLAWETAIYPYLERQFSLKPFEVWQRYGKTKRRRLTPLLRALIDPNNKTRSDKVRLEVATFRIKERARVAEEGAPPDYDETRQMVLTLLGLADTLTSRDMEEKISPEHTPGIDMLGSRHPLRILDENGAVIEERVVYFVWFEATEDQITLLRRRFPDRLDLRIQGGAPITRRRER